MQTFARSIALAGLLGLTAGFAHAADTTINVLYANDRTTAEAHEEIKTRFEAENPGIKISFLAPADSYETATQNLLRGALIGDLPDVVFQGQNLIRSLVDRNLAVPLNSFIEADGGAEKLGYDAGMLRIGTLKDRYYAIPFAVSTPLVYVNLDLVKAAGVDPDHFPTNWADMVALGKKLNDPAKGVTGFYFQWDVTGNWMFQSLDFSYGGQMLSADEKTATLDSPAGMKTLETLESFAKAGMPNLPSAQARPAFAAGKIAIFGDSSSNLGKATTMIGKNFQFRTYPFPLPSADAKLPAGGNAAVMLTKDAEKQKAVWKYIKFATGPIGQTIMARHTGYLPSNNIAIQTADLLGDYYASQPNCQTSIKQIPILTGWYAFPGPNGLKIIDVIKNHLEAVVMGKKTATETASAMNRDVQALLP
ncbi:ABC transporter substrate-binding protein [Neorhizobium sp. P12A]|uniref:ABC transporter substrate-binding protein n=1 Tax=Neorhizobium sp. P12A TaxID=2268027 RepID=UPI0011ED4137|nr:ABC transporter substrate-binding protein [Neorhizobium sp. P12A]KAA0697950.1 ABC transporter substrate-binding protein [Neorhizobium sp. P12A]